MVGDFINHYGVCNCAGQCWLYGNCIAQRPVYGDKTFPTYNIPKPPQVGWICPRCKTVNAPFMTQCVCNPESEEAGE